MQRTNWSYHCFVMHVTQQWTSSHENVLFIVVTDVTHQHKVPARLRVNENSDASLKQLHSVCIQYEPG